tara:strand:+ start:8098 stop:8394 length:297 start_codon:yes stop_codon:yes gene_type:complete
MIEIITYIALFLIGGLSGYLISSIKFKNLNRYGLSKKMYLSMMVLEINKNIDRLIEDDTAESYIKAFELDQEKRKLLKRIKKLTNGKLSKLQSNNRKL